MDKLVSLRNTLNAELENILLQIVGVTDPIRREQAEAEYNITCEKINKCCEEIKALQDEQYIKLIEEKIRLRDEEEKKKIISAYKQTSCLIEALEETNIIDMKNDIIKNRIRVRNDRRTILQLANALDKRISVYNLRGDIIDTLGRGNDDLILYVWVLDNVPVYDLFAVEDM